MKTGILRLVALAVSVLLWFAIPSFGQTNQPVGFPKNVMGIGPFDAVAAIALINNSSKPTGKDTLFADGHFQNSSNDNWNSHNDLRKSRDDYGKLKEDHGKSNGGCQDGNSRDSTGCGKRWVSAAEGGASVDYLLFAGITCCAAIYLRRKQQWAERDLA